MRKIKLQMQVSLDGFVAGPNGEMDWMTLPWTEDINEYVDEITDSFDCIILGRKLAEGFIPYWASVAADPNNPEAAAGRKFTDTLKVVFTKTLNQSPWDNTVLAEGDLVQEITKLKKQDGKDIVVYGGATLVSALIKHNLIDEYHLFINPVALGKGMPIFNGLQSRLNLHLTKSQSFDCGVVVLCYTPERKHVAVRDELIEEASMV